MSIGSLKKILVSCLDTFDIQPFPELEIVLWLTEHNVTERHELVKMMSLISLADVKRLNMCVSAVRRTLEDRIKAA